MAQVSSKYGDSLIKRNERIKDTEEVAVLGSRNRLALYKNYRTIGNRKLRFYYAFSDRMRNPYYGTNGIRKYGSIGVTFRWLYALLSSRTPGGSFLNRYFGPRGAVYRRLGPEISELKTAIFSYDSNGLHVNPLRGRTKSGKYFHISQDMIDRKLTAFGRRAREDCVTWLRNEGMGTVSLATSERRLRAGIDWQAKYFATGQLIEDMQLTVVAGQGE